jgi:DNA modification methylase
MKNKITKQISELREWDKNPRSIKEKDFERLKKQILKLGQYKPILITPDGEVIGGNMRLKAYRELGIEDIWVSVVNPKDENEKLEYALSDNDRAGFYDEDLLANLTGEYPEFNWGDYAVDLKEPQTLEDLIQSLAPIEEDEVPEVSDEPAISQLSEVYQLGRHRLMCGDSTKIEDVEKLMNGQKADMVFTDPPYNIASESKNYASDVSKSMNDLKNSEWDKDFDITKAIPNLQNFLKENSTTYIFTSHFLFGTLYEIYKKWADFTSYCVWSKPNPMPSLSKRHWTWNTELCLYATKGKHTFNFPDGSNELSTWSVNKKSDGSHPTQKPIELCIKPIKNSSKQDDIILDLFGGSGSTLIACEQTNRTCYMMELDERYCDVIRKRYENFTKNR